MTYIGIATWRSLEVGGVQGDVRFLSEFALLFALARAESEGASHVSLVGTVADRPVQRSMTLSEAWGLIPGK